MIYCLTSQNGRKFSLNSTLGTASIAVWYFCLNNNFLLITTVLFLGFHIDVTNKNVKKLYEAKGRSKLKGKINWIELGLCNLWQPRCVRV